MAGGVRGARPDPRQLRARAGERGPRALLRTGEQLVREKASHTQRLQKTPEDADIKPGSVVSDVPGVGGRATIGAPIAGETDPAVLAGRAHPRPTVAGPKLREALRGRVRRRRRFRLGLHLRRIDALAAAIAAVMGRAKPAARRCVKPSGS